MYDVAAPGEPTVSRHRDLSSISVLLVILTTVAPLISVFFIVITTIAAPSPVNIHHSVVSSSAEGASVSVQWDPPTDSGGRDDLTYTVTISPPAQLSATVVTSTSVTVSAADYNENYTVSVVATNCAGNSTVEEYSFRVGELVVVVCGK